MRNITGKFNFDSTLIWKLSLLELAVQYPRLPLQSSSKHQLLHLLEQRQVCL